MLKRVRVFHLVLQPPAPVLPDLPFAVWQNIVSFLPTYQARQATHRRSGFGEVLHDIEDLRKQRDEYMAWREAVLEKLFYRVDKGYALDYRQQLLWIHLLSTPVLSLFTVGREGSKRFCGSPILPKRLFDYNYQITNIVLTLASNWELWNATTVETRWIYTAANVHLTPEEEEERMYPDREHSVDVAYFNDVKHVQCPEIPWEYFRFARPVHSFDDLRDTRVEIDNGADFIHDLCRSNPFNDLDFYRGPRPIDYTRLKYGTAPTKATSQETHPKCYAPPTLLFYDPTDTSI